MNKAPALLNQALLCLGAMVLPGSPCPAAPDPDAAPARAAPGDDVVLHRLYPKAHTIEVELGTGWLLNPSFVDTQLSDASVRYHGSETWGLGLIMAVAKSKDRAERACVESFYNDPDKKAGAPCASQDNGAALAAGNHINVGPAYVPIREIEGLAAVALDYTIAYGKQIVLTGAVNNFDLRLRFGAGALQAAVYDESLTVRGDPARPARGDPGSAGVGAGHDANGALYGAAGRPDPRQVTSPLILIGLVEEMDFLRRFFLTGEVTAYVTTGISGGIDPFFVAQLGVGLRL